MLSVLIVDDHAVVRRGVRSILVEEISGVSIGEASSANEALTMLRKQRWDLVILDIAMPGRSGQDVLGDIKYQWPTLPVVILSMYPEEELAVRLLKSGASGYVVKESAPEELAKAVRKVLDGGRYISERLSDRIVMSLQSDSNRAPHEALSTREFEVMLKIVAGMSITEIARELGLSVKTVSTYHGRVLEKMNMTSDASLASYCVRHGLAG